MMVNQGRGILLAVLLSSVIPVFSQVVSEVFEPATPQQFAGYGRSLAAPGDLNSDGIADLLVGAPAEDAGGFIDAGRVYVISGATGNELYALDTPNPQQFGTFGFTLAVADLTGDGIADLLIGSQEDSNGISGAGRIYARNGIDAAPLYILEAPMPEQFAWFSRAICTIDDIDNDGIAEVVASSGESAGTTAGVGRVYVFSGADGAPLYNIDSPNPTENGLFGLAMASIADLNNDGISDLLIGSEESAGSFARAGRAYVFSGADGMLIYTLNTTNPQTAGRFGWSVAAAGDVNNDGSSDLIIGSLEDAGGFVDAGRAYLFSGATGNQLYAVEAPAPFHVDWFSRSVSAAGDVNGDGMADLLIGTPLADGGGGVLDAGKVYLFSGANGTVLDSLVSPNLENEGLFGFALLGDWNANRLSGIDVLVSGYREDVAAVQDAGRVYRMRSEKVSIATPHFAIPFAIQLKQNYPNPFNPVTRIAWVQGAGFTELAIYDALGRRVRTLLAVSQAAGNYEVEWDGRNDAGIAMPSGIYLYRLVSGMGSAQMRLMVLAR